MVLADTEPAGAKTSAGAEPPTPNPCSSGGGGGSPPPPAPPPAGLGVCEDHLVARFLVEARAFRIYEGPSEVLRSSIARRALRARQPRA
ncbi:acyl-CoA dehydrogenase family protein [Nocardia farcinica]|uniref:acyl-CoA dehydrogenase family protein n=1 Tax=Nocardia farcinica TaxID=37329 RepID=UPI003CC7CB93